MGPDPNLTEAAVRDLSRPQSYDRGTNYHDEGAVADIVQRGGMIRSAVEGSQYEPYQVRIDLDETGDVDTSGYDRDFIWLAAEVLWNRWAPDIPN